MIDKDIKQREKEKV